MDWAEIGRLVAKSAPVLGGVLAGEGGAAFGQIVASAFGVEATPGAVSAAIAANPDATIKLREIERDARLGLLEFRVKQAAIEVQNTADARARDAAIRKGGGRNYRADILATLSVGGLVMCVYLISTNAGLSERATNAIMMIAGVLASAVRDVFNFEFGSSRGSKTKDEALAEAVRAPMRPAPVEDRSFK